MIRYSIADLFNQEYYLLYQIQKIFNCKSSQKEKHFRGYVIVLIEFHDINVFLLNFVEFCV